MEKEFVPFELAVKLKELGFNEKCLAYLEDKRVCYAFDDSSSAGLLELENSKYNTVAPLWQQAFDWFREKYNLFPIVDFYRINGYDKRLYFYTIDVYEVGRETDDKFESYQEARTACLKKLIEIASTTSNKQH